MSFVLPRPRAVLYRLIRLRRLIAVAAVLPIVVAGLVGLISWAMTGVAPGSLVPVSILSLALAAGHAVLFPQARSETLALSIVLSFLILAAPLAGGSILGWALLLAVAVVAVMLLQSRLLMWEMSSALRPMRVQARVRSELDPAEALLRYPLRPGRESDPRLICGAADAEGVFPVRIHKPQNPMADLLCAAYPVPEGLEAEILAELEALEQGEAEAGLVGSEWADLPDFWAMVLSDDADGVEVLVLVENEEGRLAEASRVTYRVIPRRSGCVLEETDVNPGFPVAAALGMWLTDFATDGLVMTRDGLEGRETLAIRATPDVSLLTLAGQWVVARRIRRMDAT